MILNVMEVFKFIILLPVFHTQLFQMSNFWNNVCLIIRIITILYCFSLYLTHQRNIGKFSIFMILVQGEAAIVSHLNGYSIMDSLAYFNYFVSVAMLFDIYANEINKLIKNVVIYCKILVYGNAISILVFRNGIKTLVNPPYAAAPVWFIGVSNSFVFWLYPAIVFLMVDYFINKNRKTLIPILIASVMNLFSDSSTGLVGTVIFLSILFIPKLKEIITPIRLGIIAVVLFAMIVIVGQSSFLEPIVVGILSKDMTFSGRAIIWGNAIVAIIAKPIFGYGRLFNDETILLLGGSSNGSLLESATHCHSEYLQLAFRYGLIGASLFFVSIMLVLIHCTKNRNDVKLALGVGLGAMMIMGITEVFTYPLSYLLLFAGYYFNVNTNDEYNEHEEKE